MFGHHVSGVKGKWYKGPHLTSGVWNTIEMRITSSPVRQLRLSVDCSTVQLKDIQLHHAHSDSGKGKILVEGFQAGACCWSDSDFCISAEMLPPALLSDSILIRCPTAAREAPASVSDLIKFSVDRSVRIYILLLIHSNTPAWLLQNFYRTSHRVRFDAGKLPGQYLEVWKSKVLVPAGALVQLGGLGFSNANKFESYGDKMYIPVVKSESEEVEANRLLGMGGPVYLPLGMQSGTISNKQITCSSRREADTYEAIGARLHRLDIQSGNCWAPARQFGQEKGEWIQVIY
jgi:hypothetical protein